MLPHSAIQTTDLFQNWTLIPRTTMICSPKPLEQTSAEKLLEEIKTNGGKVFHDAHLIKYNDQYKVCFPTFKITQTAVNLFPSLKNFSFEKIVRELNRRIYVDPEALIDKLDRQLKSCQKFQEPTACQGWENDLKSEPKNELLTYSGKDFSSIIGNNHYLEDIGFAQVNEKSSSASHEYVIQNIEIIIGDRRIFIPIFGIFAGHPDASCARYLTKRLPEYLQERIQSFIQEERFTNLNIFNLLKLAFVDLGDEFLKENNSKATSSSTAILAFLYKDDLWVANVGDSRCILKTSETLIGLSEDAKSDVKKYYYHVLKRGRKFFKIKDDNLIKIKGYLDVARSIGHREESSGINPRPKIVKIKLLNLPEGDNYLVIASKELWNIANSNQVGNMIQKLAKENINCCEIARQLSERFFKGNEDSVLIIVIKILQPYIASKMAFSTSSSIQN